MKPPSTTANSVSLPGVPPDHVAQNQLGTISPETGQPAPASLSHRTAHGLAWMISQSLATKLINMAGQIVIAWYLLREDFGLVSLAYMFSILPALIQQGGIREVLISRHGRFKVWANAAFWLSVTVGLAGAAFMVCIAPVAASLYEEPRLLGLLLIVAVLFPLDSIATVPLAQLQSQMRFRLLASITVGQAAIHTALAIYLAYAGFGPYSLILPRLVVSVVLAVFVWQTTRVPVRARLQTSRWRYLAGDGVLVIFANGFELATVYIGYLVLSVIYDTGVVGLYKFAVDLSTQATALITYQLGSVLFPALTKLQHDVQRQALAFLRAVRMLACFAITGCLLQAAMTDAAVHALFPERWWDAIAPLQILSIGMAMRAAGWPAISLMQAQARFKARLTMVGVSFAVLAIFVVVGAWLDGVRGAAIGTAMQMIVTEPVALYVALRPARLGWSMILRTLMPPMALAIACVGPAWLAASMIGAGPGQHWWRMGVMTLISGALFFPLFRLLLPETFFEARERFGALLWRPSRVAPA